MIPAAPGFYTYTDPGAPPQRVQVVDDAGVLCARFVDDDRDVDLVPVADMAGEFTPIP